MMMARQYNDLIGDILEASGEKDNLKGKGKPLSKEYLQMDTFQHFQKIAKDAGHLPPWLTLQKEIFQLLDTCQSESDVDAVNEKIRTYNLSCPPPMQRGLVTLENVEKAKESWQ